MGRKQGARGGASGGPVARRATGGAPEACGPDRGRLSAKRDTERFKNAIDFHLGGLDVSPAP